MGIGEAHLPGHLIGPLRRIFQELDVYKRQLHAAVDQLLLGMVDDTSVLVQNIDIALIAQADTLAQLPDGVVIQDVYKRQLYPELPDQLLSG